MHLHYATNLYLLMSQHATYMTPYSKDQTTVMQRGQMFGKGFLQCLKAFPTVKYFAKYMWKLNKVIIVRLNIQFVPNLRLNKEIYGDFEVFYIFWSTIVNLCV